MSRFSARGAYLLLAPQGRALIQDRALIQFFEKQPNVQNKALVNIVCWFGYLQLTRPQSIGSVFAVNLCMFERVSYCRFRNKSYFDKLKVIRMVALVGIGGRGAC